MGNKKKPFIRVCHWDRQSGKTTFIMKDALDRLKHDGETGVILISPDAQHSRMLRDKFIALVAEDSKFDLGSINYMDRVAILSVKEFAWHSPNTIKSKSRVNRVFTQNPDGEVAKTIYIYCDEVNYFGVSFEQLMLAIDKLNSPSVNVSHVTVTATRVNKPSHHEKAEQMIRSDQGLSDGSENFRD